MSRLWVQRATSKAFVGGETRIAICYPNANWTNWTACHHQKREYCEHNCCLIEFNGSLVGLGLESGCCTVADNDCARVFVCEYLLQFYTKRTENEWMNRWGCGCDVVVMLRGLMAEGKPKGNVRLCHGYAMRRTRTKWWDNNINITLGVLVVYTRRTFTPYTLYIIIIPYLDWIS